jgi:cell wall-associated NlpC family hydrolase
MTSNQRKHAAALMDDFMTHASQILYPPSDQRNGLEAYDWGLTEAQLHTLLLNRHQVEFDCSDSSSWIYAQVGAWPKSRGPGYTGTWLGLGLTRYKDGKIAQVAAPVIFGTDKKPDGHHMGLVHTPDPKHGNPIISEHGSAGWAFTHLKDVIARQTAEGYPGYTFLNVSRL